MGRQKLPGVGKQHAGGQEWETQQDRTWAWLRHPKLLLAGVAGMGEGEGAVKGTGTGQWRGGAALHLQ